MATLMSRTGRFSRPNARDPFASLHEEVNQLINDFFDGRNGGDLSTVLSPSFDLSETDDAYQLQMDLPGVDAADIDIELRADSVTVCGERNARKNRRVGHFTGRSGNGGGSAAQSNFLATSIRKKSWPNATTAP